MASDFKESFTAQLKEEDVKDVAVATPEPAAVSVQEVPVKEDCKAPSRQREHDVCPEDLRQRVEGLEQLVLDLQASLKAKERALQDWEERFQARVDVCLGSTEVQAEKKVTCGPRFKKAEALSCPALCKKSW